jgi:hypothetical protein
MKISKEIMKILKQMQDSKDVRDYCQGIHLYQDGYAAATNGAIAFISNKLDGDAISKNMIIKVGTLAMSGIEYFEIEEKLGQLVGMNKKGSPVSYIPFEVLNTAPANFKAIADKHEPSLDGVATFDPSYLKALSVFPSGSQVTFKIGAGTSTSFAIGDEGTLLIMPQAYKERDLPALLQ